MLDVSIRSGILNLLLDLKDKYGIPYLFITHDLSVARYMSDRIGVMYLGTLVETAEAETVIKNPHHPYTRALLSSVPVPDPYYKRKRKKIKGDLPSPIDVPKGCRFWPRCPFAKKGICDKKDPPVIEVEPGHFVKCHFAKDIPAMDEAMEAEIEENAELGEELLKETMNAGEEEDMEIVEPQ
jgi:peptide/nickel transport system ATP-binding protein